MVLGRQQQGCLFGTAVLTKWKDMRNKVNSTQWQQENILSALASSSMAFFPKICAISSSASWSSLDWKNGKCPVNKHNSITPADHMSIATHNSVVQNLGANTQQFRLVHSPVVWCTTFNKTSGALNPRVPARLARGVGLTLCTSCTLRMTACYVLSTRSALTGDHW